MRDDTRGAAIVAGIGIGVVGVFFVALPRLGFGDYLVANTVAWVWGSGFQVGLWVLGFIGAIAAIWMLAVAAWGYDGYYASMESVRTIRKRLVIGGVAVGVGTVMVLSVCFVWVGSGRAQYTAARWWVQNVVDVNGDAGPYAERLSLNGARALLEPAAASVGGELTQLTHLSDSVITGLVTTPAGKDVHTWTLAVVELNAATGQARIAQFEPDTVGTPRGMFGSRLGAQVSSVYGAGRWVADGDQYGYIDDAGRANLVVPLYGYTGRINYHQVPLGVATFDSAGTLRVDDTVVPGQLPGPVLGRSFAQQVRTALNARDGYAVFRSPDDHRGSVRSTDGQGGLGVSVNETLLRHVDSGRLVYVTPLTTADTARAVVAYLEVFADTVTAGRAPEARLVTLTAPQASPQDVALRLASLYVDLSWGTSDPDHLRTYDIAPAGPGQVVALIGNATSTLYRMRVDAVLVDGSAQFGLVCVDTYPAGEQLRCDTADVTRAPAGSFPATDQGAVVDSLALPDFGGLDVATLRAIIAGATNELARRAGDGAVP